MSFCVNCAEQLAADAKFCRNCGTAVAVATGRPVGALASETVPGPPRLFAALPVGDYVRDGLAAVSLVASLFMVWLYNVGDGIAGSGIAATRIDVILVTLLSLASLGIPYLWRSGVLGPAWNSEKTQDARILVNAPYFVMVTVYVIIAMVAGADSESLTTFVLGPAMAFGLAGAALAAQPRRAEHVEGDARRDKRWVAIALGLAGLVALFTIVQIVELLLHSSLLENAAYDLGSLLIVVIMSVASPVILAVIAFGVARSENSWRLVGIGLGVAAAILGLLSLSPQVTLVQARFDGSSPDFSLMFWVAFGAVIAAPSIARLTPVMSGITPWIEAARTVLAVAVGMNVLVGVVSIVALIRAALLAPELSSVFNPIPWVVALFFSVIGIVGGIVVRAMVAKGYRQGYVLATAYAVLLFVLGLVLVVLWSVQGLGGIGPLTMLIAFVIPVGLAVLLWGPESSRQHFPALPSAGGQAASAVSIEGGRRESPTQPAPGGNLDAIRAEAVSPATSAARLREIAATIPEARAAVASNPAAYPGLLTWLGSLGDPVIDAALVRRTS